MPSMKKRQQIQSTQKRQKRGRLYIIALVVLVTLGIGLYVYASSLPPGPPDFAISAPTGVTVTKGTPNTTTINVTAINKFSGTVQLSATSSPAGLNASFNPPTVTGSGTTTLTLTATYNGTFTLTVTGTSGSLKHTTSPHVATAFYATLQTSQGPIEIELFAAQTPQTVSNFVKLAESGFYNNLTWHRIVAGFVIQTGDPNTRNGTGNRSTWGQGGSGQSVPFEYDPSLHNAVGYVGMASTAAGAGGTSQFYINVNDNSAGLDGKYAVFGKVISGMNAVNALASLSVNSQSQPLDATKALVTSVTISLFP